MTDKNRCVIYARVSTVEQETSNQTQALTTFAASRGLEVVKVYQEAESAWCGGHQHELALLKGAATRGRFDILLVWALDRLSREGPLKVLQLVQSFQVLGVKLMSYQEAWTWTDGPMAELLYSITAWVAKYESDRRSERTKAGMLRKAHECPDGRIPPRGPDKHKRKKRTARQPLWGVE